MVKFIYFVEEVGFRENKNGTWMNTLPEVEENDAWVDAICQFLEYSFLGISKKSPTNVQTVRVPQMGGKAQGFSKVSAYFKLVSVHVISC